MRVDKMSDEVMQEMFETAFAQQVGSYNNLDEFEAIIKRSAREEDIYMEVTVTGMAGSPTQDEFKSGKVDRAEKVEINDPRGSMVYTLQKDKIVNLNATDYIVPYKLEL